MFLVTSKVLMLGCFDIESMMASSAFNDANPIFTALPSTTSATSDTTTGLSLMVLI